MLGVFPLYWKVSKMLSLHKLMVCQQKIWVNISWVLFFKNNIIYCSFFNGVLTAKFLEWYQAPQKVLPISADFLSLHILYLSFFWPSFPSSQELNSNTMIWTYVSFSSHLSNLVLFFKVQVYIIRTKYGAFRCIYWSNNPFYK